MSSFFRPFKRAIRGLLGTDAVLRHLQVADENRQRNVLLLGNAIQYAAADPADVRALPEHARAASVVKLLQTCRVEGTPMARIGGEIDGGYVMLDTMRPPTVTASRHWPTSWPPPEHGPSQAGWIPVRSPSLRPSRFLAAQPSLSAR